MPREPENWPSNIVYLTTPEHSPNLTVEQVQQLRTRPATQQVPTIKLEETRTDHIDIKPISSPSHPACGQHGVFAHRTLLPDELVTVYLGLIHGESEADQRLSAASDYDISLDRDIGVAIDAASCGNHGRFVNDYRGVAPKGKNVVGGGGANAEFRDVWIEYADEESGVVVGERGMAIFVLGAGRSGKRKGGIRAGEEVLVSYGRGFWECRRREDEDEELVLE